MKREYTILIDEREKKPLRFPAHLSLLDDTCLPTSPSHTTVRLHTRSTRLLTGDYQLEGFQHAVIAERKGSLDELSTNLLTPQGRRKFIAELERLRTECAYPLILLEGSPLTLQNTRLPASNPIAARDALLRVSIEYNVPILLLPTTSVAARDATAEWLASLLISGALRWPRPPEKSPSSSPPSSSPLSSAALPAPPSASPTRPSPTAGTASAPSPTPVSRPAAT